MPAKRYRKTPQRKNYQKRRRYYKRRNNRSVIRSNRPTGIPDTMQLKMKYTSAIDITDAGAGGVYVFRGNSIYDPDYTSTGGQPTSRDEWAAFYNYYRVRASKIRTSFVSLSNLASTSAMIAIIPSLSVPTTTISPLTIVDQPYARYKIIGQGDGSNNATYLNNYMSTQKMFGRTIQDNDFVGLMSNLPLNEWYWGIKLTNMVSGGGGTYRVIVQLTYYVELFERVVLAAS